MYRIPPEQLETFEQQFHPVAEAQVRRDLVLEAVAEQQGLQATEAEIDARIARIAERAECPGRRGLQPAAEGEPAARARAGITEEKVFDYLLSQSTVEEVKS